MTGIRIGTAGWSIPRASAMAFPAEGTHLERYAARFDAVEINSSFYRPHRTATYARWAASVPKDFRFSVKLPRTITHERRLAGCGDLLARFAGEVSGLNAKLGVVLVQLPPSLGFDADIADAFLLELRGVLTGAIACEPRHPGWFGTRADALLAAHDVARVASDPARVAQAAVPGGTRNFAYYRWHGSPHVYHSSYDPARLAALAKALPRTTWVILDNTAAGAAIENALLLRELARAG